jgi:hypothetical protein
LQVQLLEEGRRDCQHDRTADFAQIGGEHDALLFEVIFEYNSTDLPAQARRLSRIWRDNRHVASLMIL